VGDVALLTLAQGLPLPTLLVLGVAALLGAWGDAAGPLLAVNACWWRCARCAARRCARRTSRCGGVLAVAVRRPAGVLRIVLSTVRRPTRWRGRTYALEARAERRLAGGRRPRARRAARRRIGAAGCEEPADPVRCARRDAPAAARGRERAPRRAGGGGLSRDANASRYRTEAEVEFAWRPPPRHG
jgi:hypothetical protein